MFVAGTAPQHLREQSQSQTQQTSLDRTLSLRQIDNAQHPTAFLPRYLGNSYMHATGGESQQGFTAPPGVPDVLHSSGRTLDLFTRSLMEAHLGYDFSQVRVHTDGQAATSAEALRASSYTVGQDIVFGAGQFSPHTAQGQRILGHELTHVVQQGRRASSPNRLVSSPGDAAEVEAEHVATSLLTPASENPVVVGVSAQPAATVQRQAWPGEEFSPTAPSGFGLGAARPSPLRFAFGLRAGQPVTEGPLIEWAFEQAEQGVTFRQSGPQSGGIPRIYRGQSRGKATVDQGVARMGARIERIPRSAGARAMGSLGAAGRQGRPQGSEPGIAARGREVAERAHQLASTHQLQSALSDCLAESGI